MAIDALEVDEDDHAANALELILEQPEKLKDLDLDAFAEELKRQVCPLRQGRSQEGGRGNFKLVMIQSSHRFGLAAQICLNPVWLGGLRSASASAQPRAVRARSASPQSPPAKLDSDKFGSSRRDQTGWLD